MSNLQELQQRALDIRQHYNQLNQQDDHNVWGPKDYAMGLVGDIGDLMKLVMAKENMRGIDDVDTKLQHEFGDCLWALFVLASHYRVDLGAAFCIPWTSLTSESIKR